MFIEVYDGLSVGVQGVWLRSSLFRGPRSLVLDARRRRTKQPRRQPLGHACIQKCVHTCMHRKTTNSHSYNHSQIYILVCICIYIYIHLFINLQRYMGA